MLDAEITGLIECLDNMAWWRRSSKALLDIHPVRPVTLEEKTTFRDNVKAMEESCKKCGLPDSSFHAYWIHSAIHDHTNVSFLDIYHESDMLHWVILGETAKYRFVKLEMDKSKYFSATDSNRTPLFGERAENAFPDAIPDMIAAGNCFALEQWAASVFHSMRVLEFGLVTMANKFCVPSEKENWHNVIEGIESKVRAINESAGADWKEQKTFYGEAARHLFFLKESWRNHVMHSRDQYDEGKALSIFQHAKEFTEHLSQKLSASP